MLSVLIPVYNYDVRKLVRDIHVQAAREGVDFEILVKDDASAEPFRLMNRELKTLDEVQYSEEAKNLGRSKIRNKLADKAQYKFLLYLDCDSGIISPDYIKKYIKAANESPIVYGGTFYEPSGCISETKRLHWLHGKKREQQSAQIRNANPNRSFKTNNYMISKEIINEVRFDESLHGYGHEDTLYGFELMKRDYKVLHIENPVSHLGLESNEEFLRKTREGIKNLKQIMRNRDIQGELTQDVTLLSYYKKVEKIGLDNLIESLYKKYEHILRRNLLGRKPNLFYFDLYKLGYFCSINHKLN